MASGKGPGVIGMLLALLVIVGFGSLYMLAFENGTGGAEKSLAAIIRDNGKEITSLSARTADGEKTLESIPTLKKVSSDLDETVAVNKSTAVRISERKAEISALEDTLEALTATFEDYKNQYRAHVRNGAEGTKMEELKTRSGDVFLEVDVRKVTAVGIEFRHRDGHKRVGFEELSDELQDYYQYDKDQMLAEVEREDEVRKKHDSAVASANEAADAMAADQKIKDKEEARQKMIQDIAAKEALLRTMEGEIRQLESDIVSAENAAAAARAAGRMHLSKAGNIRSALTRKRNEYANLKADIARLHASI